jgi:hypothetical protein
MSERWLPFDGGIIGLMNGDEKRIDLSKSFKIFGVLFTQFYVPVRVPDESPVDADVAFKNVIICCYFLLPADFWRVCRFSATLSG